MTLMTKMMMLMMHVYRKYVVFNIYNVYLYMIWRILYIFKVLLGVLCNAEHTFRRWCNKIEAGHILAIYIYPLSISSVIVMISICSRYGMYFIDYMINLYISFFFCINTFYMWLPLFSLFIILCHISVLCIVFLGGWWVVGAVSWMMLPYDFMQCIVSCTWNNDAMWRGNRQALLTELCISYSCRQIAIQKIVSFGI